MLPSQYPPFALIHLDQNGQEFPEDSINTRFYFETFDEVPKYIANSPDYVLKDRDMTGIAMEWFPTPTPHLAVQIRYDRGYLRCLKVTGPVTQLSRIWVGANFWNLLAENSLEKPFWR